MSFLFIGSTGDRSGHSLLTWAIARRLLSKRLRVGFLKPFGARPVHVGGIWTDPDASLFKEVLNLDEPFERICPYQFSEEAWRQKETKQIIEELQSLSREIYKGKDVLLLMGSGQIFFDDVSTHISDISLVTGLMADLVFINRYREMSRSIYSILSVCSLLKERVRGIILNRVPAEKVEKIRTQMIPSFANKGIPFTAAMPEDPELLFRSLGEIREALDGKVLWGEESLSQPVSRMTVGASDLKGELRLFKRAYNKIILLAPSHDSKIEGDESRRSISGIILTGGQDPAPQLLESAKKANIPLMLVKHDAFAVLERLEMSSPALSPKDEGKVSRFTELMDRDGSLDMLLQSIGHIP